MIRNIVLSDTGGWLPHLLNSFDELGIDAEVSTIPKDMRIIHCGDLIHKGPFSSQLLAIVTGLMVNNPGRWIQLMGNHEAQHLPGAPVFWQCDCSAADVGLLNLLHEEGLMLPTHALVDDAEFAVPGLPELTQPNVAMIFSHGGLTEGFWHWAGGANTDPREVSRLLNDMSLKEVCAPGIMLGESVPPSQVGPVWALGNTEVFHSWEKGTSEKMPFTQFHGHATSYSYDWKKWWPDLENFRSKSHLIPGSRATVTELNNNLMLGVDPGFNEREPRVRKQPWIEFFTNS